MNTLKRDLDHGLRAELSRQSTFESYFGSLKKTGKYDSFVIIWTLTDQSYFWEFTENDVDENDLGTWFFKDRVMDRRKGKGMQSQDMVEVFNSAIKPLSEFR